MKTQERVRIEWPEHGLVAIEPDTEEVRGAAPALAAAYNDPHNAVLMGHTEESSVDDVVEHFEVLADEGARAFFLYRDGELMGDADVRGVEGGSAELAIMIGARQAQGKGLGTRFALMVCAFAFRALGLARLVVAIVPQNTGSRRLFEKLGFTPDLTPTARSYAEHPDEITMSITGAELERLHADALGALRIVRRGVTEPPA